MTGERSIPSTSRRGFAGILAITLLILVSATLAVVASAFSLDARRTRAITADAQPRQLLTAGAVTAATQLRAGDVPTARQAIPLPAELTDRGAIVSVSTTIANGTATVRVDAEFASARAGQVVRFTQREGAWSVTSTELE